MSVLPNPHAKLPLAVDGNEHRDPQLHSGQRLRDFGVCSLNKIPLSQPSRNDSGIFVEEGTDRLQEPEVVDDFKEPDIPGEMRV